MNQRPVIAILLLLGCLHLGAQNDYRKAHGDFTRQAKHRHDSFTDTVNVIFARTIGADWVKYALSDENARQVFPEPEILPIAGEMPSQFKVLNISEAIDTLPARWPMETDNAMWTPDVPANRNNAKVVRFVFYDVEQVVSVPKEYGAFHPKGVSEADVAAFWTALSQYDYKYILADCAKYIELYGYNDWAILEWVQALSAAVLPQNTHSEQTILTVFLLNQMGLMTKLARVGNQLISMFSSMQPVFARKFIVIDTYPFYLTEKNLSASEVFTYNADFMKPSRPLDLRVRVAPSFGGSGSFKTIHRHSTLFNFSFDLPLNQALIQFYGGYPQTVITVYATAQPESHFSSALRLAVGNRIKGVPEVDAVNQLLAFVQTDFGYQTDISQFGYEKPFFCEENFVYGSNDCEDRAALFVFLVRSLLGNDMVLLEYPDHVSTAVRLEGDIKGDHIRLGNGKYYVCDPSFIGATLGMTMTKYKNTSVKVYAL